jgi:succinate dehydrogenase subunit C (EC 1.3.5.1)
MTKPASPPARPVYRNIHISQIVGYRLPLAGLVPSCTVSGAVMFLALPLVLWAFDDSLRRPTVTRPSRNFFRTGSSSSFCSDCSGR